jgi:hypothetical protein
MHPPRLGRAYFRLAIKATTRGSGRADSWLMDSNNALSRVIVVHAAWYVNADVFSHSGMLGRSQGCFGVADSSLPEIMTTLGPGRLIHADKA